jgi:hypothetical protein
MVQSTCFTKFLLTESSYTVASRKFFERESVDNKIFISRDTSKVMILRALHQLAVACTIFLFLFFKLFDFYFRILV